MSGNVGLARLFAEQRRQRANPEVEATLHLLLGHKGAELPAEFGENHGREAADAQPLQNGGDHLRGAGETHVSSDLLDVISVLRGDITRNPGVSDHTPSFWATSFALFVGHIPTNILTGLSKARYFSGLVKNQENLVYFEIFLCCSQEKT